MRLFIAIQFDKNMHKALTGLQDQLRSQGVTGNYTRPENLHLTLAFIGEYPDPEEVLQAMEEVSFTPFRITQSGAGNFGELFWIGIEKNDALSACVRRLRKALSEHNIPFDRKKFSPHITIVRKMRFGHSSGSMEQDLRSLLASIKLPSESMIVEKISLMRSDRGKQGMIYTEIGSIEMV